jgi:sec-independent protein translocase protein TatA
MPHEGGGTMFQNIGFSEILLIGVVALLLFGPRKLPEIGRMLGKTLNEFKKGARELMEEVKTETPPRQAPSEQVREPLTAAQTHEQAETQDAPEQNPARRLPD